MFEAFGDFDPSKYEIDRTRPGLARFQRDAIAANAERHGA